MSDCNQIFVTINYKCINMQSAPEDCGGQLDVGCGSDLSGLVWHRQMCGWKEHEVACR